MSPRPRGDRLDAARSWAASHQIDLDLSLNDDQADLALIRVPPRRRRQGLANDALTVLCALADHHALTVTTALTTEFGASRRGLEALVKRHGFIANRRPRVRFDVPIGTTHYRNPVRSEIQTVIEEFAA